MAAQCRLAAPLSTRLCRTSPVVSPLHNAVSRLKRTAVCEAANFLFKHVLVFVPCVSMLVTSPLSVSMNVPWGNTSHSAGSWIPPLLPALMVDFLKVVTPWKDSPLLQPAERGKGLISLSPGSPSTSCNEWNSESQNLGSCHEMYSFPSILSIP